MKKINTLFEKRNSIPFYLKLTATIIVFITSVTIVNAQGNIKIQEEYYKIVVNAPEIKLPEEVTIKGLVKDEAGNVLANAKVKADYGGDLMTDNNGQFSFTLKKEQVTAQSIAVSYDGLVTAIRSYHPSMENTTYDITLYKPTICCKKKKCEEVVLKPIEIYFENSKETLTSEIKKQLDMVAASMKECPTATILLTGYTGYKKSNQEIADGQLDAVKLYLIEQSNIPANRIKTDKITDKSKSNTVEIKAE
ncbi:OmpA family protein [Ferruginibacter sp. SUN002]|uniref:OmpA family protein n=1 Tax=Ferruginibacter sp. SUN002 TaxID=2937789 RepID=UPI003D369C5D